VAVVKIPLDPALIATLEQGPDQGGQGDVWRDIINNLPMAHDVMAAAVARRHLGIHRYGRPLASTEGTRDADVDLAQELLDAAGYAWRAGRVGIARRMLLELDQLFIDWNQP
jgi:hypothetical protein